MRNVMVFPLDSYAQPGWMGYFTSSVRIMERPTFTDLVSPAEETYPALFGQGVSGGRAKRLKVKVFVQDESHLYYLPYMNRLKILPACLYFSHAPEMRFICRHIEIADVVKNGSWWEATVVFVCDPRTYTKYHLNPDQDLSPNYISTSREIAIGIGRFVPSKYPEEFMVSFHTHGTKTANYRLSWGDYLHFGGNTEVNTRGAINFGTLKPGTRVVVDAQRRRVLINSEPVLRFTSPATQYPIRFDDPDRFFNAFKLTSTTDISDRTAHTAKFVYRIALGGGF